MVAPATANIIGKVAGGIADDLLTTTLMATKAPVLFAPAMNVNMWENPLYQRNQQLLESLGYHFVEPASGFLACGWEGKGKLPEPQTIFEEIAGPAGAPGPGRGDGPGHGRADPRGARSGPLPEQLFLGQDGLCHRPSGPGPGRPGDPGLGSDRSDPARGVETLPSAAPMQMQAMRSWPASARRRSSSRRRRWPITGPADAPGEDKKEKAEGDLTLELEKNPDILADLGRAKGDSCWSGLPPKPRTWRPTPAKKLRSKNLDLIVANDVTQPGAGFDGETNIVRLFYRDGREEALPQQTKAVACPCRCWERGSLAHVAGSRTQLRSREELQQLFRAGDAVAEAGLAGRPGSPRASASGSLPSSQSRLRFLRIILAALRARSPVGSAFQ